MTKDATAVSRQKNGTYRVSIEASGAAAAEVLEGVGVASITVPAETYRPGPIDERLIGHSKGVRQILMECGLIGPGSKCKAACGPKEKKARTAAKVRQGIGQNESVDVPKHEGMTDGVPRCLEFPLSVQPDFKLQKNAIQELIVWRATSASPSPSTTPSSTSSDATYLSC